MVVHCYMQYEIYHHGSVAILYKMIIYSSPFATFLPVMLNKEVNFKVVSLHIVTYLPFSLM